MTQNENIHQLYRLTATEYDGHKFPHPDSVRTLGEIRQAWKFNHPYNVFKDGAKMTFASTPDRGRSGEKQVWELVL